MLMIPHVLSLLFLDSMQKLVLDRQEDRMLQWQWLSSLRSADRTVQAVSSQQAYLHRPLQGILASGDVAHAQEVRLVAFAVLAPGHQRLVRGDLAQADAGFLLSSLTRISTVQMQGVRGQCAMLPVRWSRGLSGQLKGVFLVHMGAGFGRQNLLLQ